jgi:peptidase M1-like protein
MRLRVAVVILALVFLHPQMHGRPPEPGQPSPAASAAQTAAHPLSTRVVAYEIAARLDPAKKTVNGSEVVTYHNLTGQPLQEFPFHLYLNAFQQESTFMRERKRDSLRFRWKPQDYGAIRVTSLEVPGIGDLTREMHFTQPDDANAQDHTVFEVRLPRPVPPGSDVQFKIAFEDRLPEVVARTGYKGDFFMVAQWFPKIGVWWKGAWNCHQFHADSEFFADFGTFDVTLTIPQSEIVGAAGDLVSSTNNPDGTRTLRFRSEDVHDFSWTASPHFTLIEDSGTGSAGPVKIHLLLSPGHRATAPRYIQSLKGALKLFDEWYGPYPYDRITVVDPPEGAEGAGGMEYPTLITADTSYLMPNGILLPEVVVIHEFGHQYWYGMVATNEFEEPWLDEGITSYSEAKVMAALYGSNTSSLRLPGATMSDAEQLRSFYISLPDSDPIARFAHKFMNEHAYGAIVYGKTATVLLSLEQLIGEDVLRRALRAYFLRYRFTHPTGEDFLKTVEQISGQDLHWYFDQAIYGTQVLDYEVRDVRSDPLDPADQQASHGKSAGTFYRSHVLIHRRGDFVFPIQVEVKFENGETVSEKWDGRDRWARFTYVKPARMVFAEIDPDHKVALDRNRFNNSLTLKPDTRARYKLTNYWIFLSQWLAQLLGWLT